MYLYIAITKYYYEKNVLTLSMFYGYHYECVDGFNGTNCDKRLIFVNRNRRNDSNHSLAAQEHKTVLIISKKKKKKT